MLPPQATPRYRRGMRGGDVRLVVVAVTVAAAMAWGPIPAGGQAASVVASSSSSSSLPDGAGAAASSLAWAGMDEDVFAFYGMGILGPAADAAPPSPPSPPSPPPSPPPPPVPAVRWTETGAKCAIPFAYEGGGEGREPPVLMSHHTHTTFLPS
jgi:hypothetical protein